MTYDNEFSEFPGSIDFGATDSHSGDESYSHDNEVCDAQGWKNQRDSFGADEFQSGEQPEDLRKLFTEATGDRLDDGQSIEDATHADTEGHFESNAGLGERIEDVILNTNRQAMDFLEDMSASLLGPEDEPSFVRDVMIESVIDVWRLEFAIAEGVAVAIAEGVIDKGAGLLTMGLQGVFGEDNISDPVKVGEMIKGLFEEAGEAGFEDWRDKDILFGHKIEDVGNATGAILWDVAMATAGESPNLNAVEKGFVKSIDFIGGLDGMVESGGDLAKIVEGQRDSGKELSEIVQSREFRDELLEFTAKAASVAAKGSENLSDVSKGVQEFFESAKMHIGEARAMQSVVDLELIANDDALTSVQKQAKSQQVMHQLMDHAVGTVTELVSGDIKASMQSMDERSKLKDDVMWDKLKKLLDESKQVEQAKQAIADGKPQAFLKKAFEDGVSSWRCKPILDQFATLPGKQIIEVVKELATSQSEEEFLALSKALAKEIGSLKMQAGGNLGGGGGVVGTAMGVLQILGQAAQRQVAPQQAQCQRQQAQARLVRLEQIQSIYVNLRLEAHPESAKTLATQLREAGVSGKADTGEASASATATSSDHPAAADVSSGSLDVDALLLALQEGCVEALEAVVAALPPSAVFKEMRAELGKSPGKSLRVLASMAGEYASIDQVGIGAELGKVVFAYSKRLLELGRADRDVAVAASAGSLAIAAALANAGEFERMERFVVSQQPWLAKHLPLVYQRLMLIRAEAELRRSNFEAFEAILENHDSDASGSQSLQAQRDRLTTLMVEMKAASATAERAG